MVGSFLSDGRPMRPEGWRGDRTRSVDVDLVDCEWVFGCRVDGDFFLFARRFLRRLKGIEEIAYESRAAMREGEIRTVIENSRCLQMVHAAIIGLILYTNLIRYFHAWICNGSKTV